MNAHATASAALETTLDEAAARDVLLARAFEAADPESRLVSPAERKQLAAAPTDGSTQAGPTQTAESSETQRAMHALLWRARALRELIEARYAAVPRVLGIAGSGHFVPLVVLPVAFLLGALADPLGPPQYVNLLSALLFGLIAWNLAAYVVLIVAALVRARPPLPRLVTGLTAWLAAPERSWVRASSGTEGALLASALRTFLHDWLQVGAPLHLARARTGLHLGALAFAAGAVLGLYVRGVALQYQAAWESTFLDANGVSALFDFVLTPASRLTGIALPGPSELEDVWRFRGGSGPDAGGGSAAMWIHLYAVTLGLVVGVPRLCLAGLSAWKASRLSRALPFPIDDATLLRWSAGERGGGVHVVVLPYSTGPAENATSEALRGLLTDVLGARATIEWKDPCGYGDDPPLSAIDDDARAVVLFNLAQSPEHEVHGRYVEDLARSGKGGANGEASKVLALLDESGLKRTLGAGEAAEERLAQRRKNWSNVLRDTGGEPLAVDLGKPVPDGVLARAREVLAS